jgi:DNA-binding MarR family transcriptional regulator
MSGLPHLPCLCATVRRAARTLTSLYDEVLRKHSMTITQFTILQALQLAGPVAQGQLAEILAIDSTTLTRSLRPLIKNGWIGRTPGNDRRAWSLSLSKPGKLAYETVLPDWDAAQRALRKELGPEAWLNTFQSSDQLTTAARNIGANK